MKQVILTDNDIQDIITLYTINKIPIHIIGENYKTAATRISTILKNYGVAVLTKEMRKTQPRRFEKRNQEIIKLYQDGYTCKQISILYNLSEGTISAVLKQYNIKTRELHRPSKDEIKIMIDLYCNKKQSMNIISKTLGFAVLTIKRYLEKNGIKTKTKNEFFESKKEIYDEEKVILLYESGTPLLDICEQCKLSSETKIYNIIQKFNIPLRKTKEKTKEKESQILELNNQGIMVPDIAIKLNVSTATIYNLFNNNNITYNTRFIDFSEKDTLEIIRLYTQDIKSMMYIGELYDCCGKSIQKVLSENNIEIRGKNKIPKENENIIIKGSTYANWIISN